MGDGRSDKSSFREKARRVTASLASLFLVAFVLLSCAFIAMEAGHDCEGEDCPVCACIVQCENVLRQMGGAFIAACFAVFLISQILLEVCPAADFFRRDSLVNLRVRLND